MIYIRNSVLPFKMTAAKRMRKNPTPQEAALWKVLRSKGAGAKMRRQAVIRGWIADFYCPQAKLIVEVDGGYHNSRKDKDERRDAILQEIGIKTIRFTNDEVETCVNLVLSKIALVIRDRILSGVKPFPSSKSENGYC